MFNQMDSRFEKQAILNWKIDRDDRSFRVYLGAGWLMVNLSK